MPYFLTENLFFQPSSVNKLGLAAPTSDFLDLKLSEESPEELLRKQKVEEFVSKLTPEQLKIQQTRVQVGFFGV